MNKMTYQRRKVRKAMFNAPQHKRRKMMSSHLSDGLIKKYNLRALPIRKGDKVKIMRGSLRGHVEKVAEIDRKALKIMIEGATIAKSDRKMVPRLIDPSNVIIMDLDLSDPWRRKKLERLAERKISSIRAKKIERKEKEEKEKAEKKKEETKEVKKEEVKTEKKETKEEVKKETLEVKKENEKNEKKEEIKSEKKETKEESKSEKKIVEKKEEIKDKTEKPKTEIKEEKKEVKK